MAGKSALLPAARGAVARQLVSITRALDPTARSRRYRGRAKRRPSRERPAPLAKTTGRDPWSVRSGTAGPGPRNLRSSGLGSAARRRGARRTAPESIAPSLRPSSANDRETVRPRRVPWRLPCSEALVPREPTPPWTALALREATLPWTTLRNPTVLPWKAPSVARNRLSSLQAPPVGDPAAALRLEPRGLPSTARRPLRGPARSPGGSLAERLRPASRTCPSPQSRGEAP